MSRLTPEERADPYLNLNRDWARAYIVPGNRGVADLDAEVRRNLIFWCWVRCCVWWVLSFWASP
jgi:hypothetical protein